MNTKRYTTLGMLFGSAVLLGASGAADAASVMRTPTGFTAWVTLTNFADLDGSFNIALGTGQLGGEPVPLLGAVEFDRVNLNQDLRARGGIAIMDNPLFGFQETFNDDLVFSGLLQIDTGGSFSFDGEHVPQNYPANWTVTYDGNMPSSIFPIMPPLPAPSGNLAGSLTFAVDSIGEDFLNLSVTETVGSAPGWNGFEHYLAAFDAAGVPFGGTPGIIDAGLEITPGSEINTPLPAALWLLGSALAVLGAATRSRRLT